MAKLDFRKSLKNLFKKNEMDELARLFKIELGIPFAARFKHIKGTQDYKFIKDRVERVSNGGEIVFTPKADGWAGIGRADKELDLAILHIMNRVEINAKLNDDDIDTFLNHIKNAEEGIKSAKEQHRAIDSAYRLRTIPMPTIIDALESEIRILKENPELAANLIYIKHKYGEVNLETFKKSVNYLHYKKRKLKGDLKKRDGWRI